MKKIHYSWMICISCTLLLFCTLGLLYGTFNVHMPYIIEYSGISQTQASLITTVSSLSAFFSTMLFVDMIYRRLNIRNGVALAMGLGVAAMLLFGLSSSFFLYCIAAALAGAAFGTGSMIPVSIIINRWFISKRGLALGICSAGSGVAAVLSPPIVTILIENLSLRMTFFLEAAFIAGCAAFIYATIRNQPEDKGLEPLYHGEENIPQNQTVNEYEASRLTIILMMTGIVLVGAAAHAGVQHLSLLYSLEGYGSIKVSALLSISGATMTVGKLAFGRLTDQWGSYRTCTLFLIFFTLGFILCSTAGTGSMLLAIAAMFALGLGRSFPTIGIAILARDISSSSSYPKTLRNFQVSITLGNLAFAPMPGIIADMKGSYVPAYAILSILSVAALIIIFKSYRREIASIHK